MFPNGVVTRSVQIGPAFDLMTGTAYKVRVLISPSRSLIWGDTPVISSLTTVTVSAGESDLIDLPVTDQNGYKDTSGNVILLDPNDHAFYYKIDVFYLIGNSVVSRENTLRVLLPSGAGVVDIDEMISWSTGSSGETISVPDSWSAQVAEALSAAEAASFEASTKVDTVHAGGNVSVDNTDTTNPIISVDISPDLLELKQYSSMAEVNSVVDNEHGLVFSPNLEIDFPHPALGTGSNPPIFADVLIVSVHGSSSWWNEFHDHIICQYAYIAPTGRILRRFLGVSSGQENTVYPWEPISWDDPTYGTPAANTALVVGRGPGSSTIGAIPASSGLIFNGLVMRDGSGAFTVSPTPAQNTHPASKQYVDTGGWASVPATATSAGVSGSKARDANFLYICVASNQWRRVPLTTW